MKERQTKRKEMLAKATRFHELVAKSFYRKKIKSKSTIQ